MSPEKDVRARAHEAISDANPQSNGLKDLLLDKAEAKRKRKADKLKKLRDADPNLRKVDGEKEVLSPFDKWSHRQCNVKGHIIEGVKNRDGVNYKFVNTTTKEEFLFEDKCVRCGANEIENYGGEITHSCGTLLSIRTYGTHTTVGKDCNKDIV